MKNLTYVFLLFCFLLQGCASASFTKTGTANSTSFNFPESFSCDWNIYTIPPTKKYEEIGLIEFNPGMFDYVKSVSTVKKLAESKVCSNGGNGLLLWEANGFGMYKKATVIKVEE